MVRNSVFKEEKTKNILNKIFTQIKIEKKKFNSGILKSCAFIMNNDNSQSTEDKDLCQAKNDIQYLVENKEEKDKFENDNINVCFFDPKSFLKYCNLYNYFFDLEKTLEINFNNYLKNKIIKYKFPGLINKDNHYSFMKYFNEEIDNKISELKLKRNKYKTHEINEKFQKCLINKMKQYKDYVEMDEILKSENDLCKKLSYCFDNIKQNNIIEKTNVGKFKDILSSQINYVNKDIKESIDNKVSDLLTTLDEFFDSSKPIKDSREIDEFKNKINKIKDEIYSFLNVNEIGIYTIIKNYKINIIESILKKKEKANEFLKEKNYKEIINEIKEQIRKSLMELIENIVNTIDNINSRSIELIDKAKTIINDFSEGKIKLNIKRNFKQYFLKKTGNKDGKLKDQIYDEIIYSYKVLSKVFDNIGFIEVIKSFFSDYLQLIRQIDIICNVLLYNVDSILMNLINYLTNYVNKLLENIKIIYESSTVTFEKELSSSMKDVGDFYKEIKPSILFALCKLINNDIKLN